MNAMDPHPVPFPPDAAPDDGLPPELPHSIEAEQALLGAILVNNDAYDMVSSDLDADHFFEPLHGRIYEVIGQLIGQGRGASPVSLKASFEHDEAMADAGGVGYLARLAGDAVAAVHAKDYARVVSDLSARRELIRVGQDMVARGERMSADQSPDQALDEAEEHLFSLRQQFKGKAHQGGTIGSYAAKALQEAMEARENGRVPGLATGISALDDLIRLRNGHFIVLAGRPGSGKSALTIAVALNAARRGHGIYFASLEMPGEELSTRALSYLASNDGQGAAIPYFRIERGNVDQHELQRLSAARTALDGLPMWFDTRRGLQVAQIAAGARRYAKQLRKRDKSLDLIVIDHMGKCRDSGRWGGDKVNAVAEISNDIHALAGDMNIPVLAVCQLNRGVEHRDDKRPVMSDLRASGNIEEDAHLIMTVFRPAYYLQRMEPDPIDKAKWDEWDAQMKRVAHDLDVTIAKQRGGPTGQVHLWTDVTTNTFRGM
jgi:replicative DNA helicase